MKAVAKCSSVAALMVVCAGSAMGQTCARPPIGPDVIVGDLTGPQNYTPGTTGFDAGYDALALGTTSCNLGNAPLMWYNHGDVTASMPDIGNKHPAIAGALYRYTISGGASRFEQVGQSWLKHGFLALSQTLCCSNCTSTDGNTLGVGCSDPYTASRNGGNSTSTTGAGPKFQVNANTGVFPWPMPTSGHSAPSGTAETFKRIRVPKSELTTTAGGSTATTRYFGESQYISYDDALAGNQNNNASTREIAVTGTATNYSFNFVGSGTYASTNRQKSAIRVWNEIDPRVFETNIQIPGEGFLILSSRAFPLADGTWRYEYALYNMNSDRSVGSFMVPMSGATSVTNVGFHDVEYHSQDGVSATGVSYVNFDGTDWSNTKSELAMTWSCTPYATHQGANAIRWGNLFNFRFDTAAQPSFVNNMVSIGLFKPGTPDSVAATAVVPAMAGSVVELFAYLDLWFANNGVTPLNTDQLRLIDLDGDNSIGVTDLFKYLDTWFVTQ